ncbi:unnamed protein product [Paramecium primaurelia]|uniref:AtPDCT1/2 transmembrane domain-containing protein n=1 Tax=Paramecium primaurelia TaxID=5886 RepID=A0A8S1LZ02_PARPR|nr:unnamed protein product [Paramecium primaurelia]
MKVLNNKKTRIQNREDIQYFVFPDKFDHTQSGVPGNPCYNIRFRIFVFFSYIVLTQIFQLFCTPTDRIIGIQDIGHLITTPINNLYKEYRWFSILIQLLSAIILDATYLYISLYWVIYQRNFRLFASLIIFYVVRAIHLNLVKLEFPQGYFWEDPNIPSLVVKYGYFSDFFYSGHVGYLVICGLEMRMIDKKYMSAFFFFCSLFQAFVVITFQIHYTIDVTTGCIFAHYFYNQACYWEVKIDFILKILANILVYKQKQTIGKQEVQGNKQIGVIIV